LNTKNKTIIQYYYKHGWKVVRPWPDRPYRRLRPCHITAPPLGYPFDSEYGSRSLSWSTSV